MKLIPQSFQKEKSCQSETNTAVKTTHITRQNSISDRSSLQQEVSLLQLKHDVPSLQHAAASVMQQRVEEKAHRVLIAIEKLPVAGWSGCPEELS